MSLSFDRVQINIVDWSEDRAASARVIDVAAETFNEVAYSKSTNCLNSLESQEDVVLNLGKSSNPISVDQPFKEWKENSSEFMAGPFVMYSNVWPWPALLTLTLLSCVAVVPDISDFARIISSLFRCVVKIIEEFIAKFCMAWLLSKFNVYNKFCVVREISI